MVVFHQQIFFRLGVQVKFLRTGGINFDQLHSYLDREDPVGKRINFLIQEIGREINTIGSKSPQTDVTNHVIEMKGELEKIREQAKNIL